MNPFHEARLAILRAQCEAIKRGVVFPAFKEAARASWAVTRMEMAMKKETKNGRI